MSGESPTALELAPVPALGESFSRWVVDIPWIIRAMSFSFLVKGAMQLLICSSTSSWVKMRVPDSAYVLFSRAPMMQLASEL